MTWIPVAVNGENGMYLATDSKNGHELYVFDGSHNYSAPYDAAIKFKQLNAIVNSKMSTMKLLDHQVHWLSRFKHVADDINRERTIKTIG